MKIANAIKKLEKAGYEVVENAGQFIASKTKNNQVIEFMRNGFGDNVTCIKVRYADEKDDSMTDYFCGSWMDNITKAIKFADR